MFSWFRRWACRVGWHSVFVGFESVGFRHRCKWCNGVGLVDSQGNLFSVGKLPPELSPEARLKRRGPSVRERMGGGDDG